MPIYEFKCRSCNKEFETIVFTSDENVTCPECKGGNVERLMSVCGFKSGDNFTPSTGSSGCSSCSSTNCSGCH